MATKEKVKKSGKSADWEKELEAEASKERAREKGGGGGGLPNRISLDGRRFTLDKENLGRTMKVVVVDFVYLNTFYGKYKKGGVNIPKCFAINVEQDDLEPHENVKKPQNDTCDGCPRAYQGGSTAGECSNRRRLALVHEDDLDDVAEANVAYLELAPKSLKNWSKFVKECSDKLNRPYYTVMVELSFDEDEDYPVVCFEVEEKIKDKEVIDAIKEKREEIRDDLLTPFDNTSDKEEDEDDEDEDDDDKPRKKGKSKPVKKSKAKKDEDDEDEDEDEEEDEKPAKKGKGKKSKRDEEVEEDGEDDEEADDDEDDDEDDDDKPAKRRGGKSGAGGKAKGRKSSDEADDEDDEDDDEDDEDDEDEDKPKKGKVKSKRTSRFGGK